MSINLEAAFIFGLKMNNRLGKYQRDGGEELDFNYSTANYSRNLSSIEDMVVDGREFVFSKQEFDKLDLTYPKRQDVIIDDDLGTLTISEVIEMMAMGKLIGFRVRTS